MTYRNIAQLLKIYFHPQLQVQMKTSYHLIHIFIIEPSAINLVKVFVYPLFLFFTPSLLTAFSAGYTG